MEVSPCPFLLPPRLTNRWNLFLEQAGILILEDEALIAEDLRLLIPSGLGVLLDYSVVAVTDSGEDESAKNSGVGL